MEQFSFEKLDAYQEAIKLVSMVYKHVECFPRAERFCLIDQLHRAIVSVPSNLAESCGRTSMKEKIHFIEIAYGSLLESYCQLHIAVNLKYIAEQELINIKPQFFIVSRLLNGLRNSYINKLNS